MEYIGDSPLWSVNEFGELRKRSCFSVRAGAPCHVSRFVDLASHVAKLQFKNPGNVLLFRGQSEDYKLIGGGKRQYSTIKPGIFRGTPIDEKEMRDRYDTLARAEALLVKEYVKERFPDAIRLRRQQVLRWSILQHYEVCATPLLDVTQSLRIAASFASQSRVSTAFVFVLGIPNIAGAITASAEAGIEIVRLASVCPPDALRPHIQEGYLLGEHPELAGFEQQRLYGARDFDFGRRLVAKFSFDPSKFWHGTAFPKVGMRALYPNAHDRLYAATQAVARLL